MKTRKPPRSPIAQTILSRCAELDLSREELAAKSGVSFGALTKICAAGSTRMPDLATVKRIAGALGMSLDELAGESSK